MGHKHEVNHPEMSRKLLQYDAFIEQLVAYMKTDPVRWGKTMLIVCGDHGQTDDGAHGGALPQEVSDLEIGLVLCGVCSVFVLLNSVDRVRPFCLYALFKFDKLGGYEESVRGAGQRISG